MIEIRLYRYRIGTFSQKLKNRKSCTRNIDRKQNKQNISLRNILQIILRIVLIMSTVRNNSEYSVETSCNFRTTLQQQKLSCSTFPQDLTRDAFIGRKLKQIRFVFSINHEILVLF